MRVVLRDRPFESFSARNALICPRCRDRYLNLLHVGSDLAVVCRRQDAFPCWQAVAQVRHPSDPAVMSAFFKALINENGAAFGVDLFGSLPSNTHNKSGETVPESVVREAYWNWMMWAEKTVGVDWQGLAEEILERERSPIMYDHQRLLWHPDLGVLRRTRTTALPCAVYRT